MISVLMIGAGQFGCHIAKRMTELNCDVMAIDENEDRINAILPHVTNAQIGDSTNPEFMRALGVRDYDVCIVTIGDCFQDSLETTALLKELGAQLVVARAANDVQEKFLLRNGADEVVYPEKQSAVRIATKFASESILDFIEMDGSLAIYEMKPPKAWEGKTLVQLDIRRKHRVNLISMKRGEQVSVPMPDTVMQADDIVFVIGELKDIQKCFKI